MPQKKVAKKKTAMKKVSVVKKKVAKSKKIETFDELKYLDLVEDISIIDDFHTSVQKARIRLGNQIDAIVRRDLRPTDRLVLLHKNIFDQEKLTNKMIKNIVGHHPVWTCFFQFIHGVAEGLAGNLIAQIKDIKRFDTITGIWAYSGYIGGYVEMKCSAKTPHKLIMSSDKQKKCPVLKDKKGKKCGKKLELIRKVEGKAPRKKEGYHYLFNTKIKTICYKISDSFIKLKNPHYTGFYYNEKERLAKLDPKMEKWRIDLKARRKMMKIFLAHLWEAWKRLEGVEPKPPWSTAKQGHSWLQWEEVKLRIQAEMKQNNKKKIA